MQQNNAFISRNIAWELQADFKTQIDNLQNDVFAAQRLDTELSCLVLTLKSHIEFFKARGEQHTIDWLIIYYQTLQGRVRIFLDSTETELSTAIRTGWTIHFVFVDGLFSMGNSEGEKYLPKNVIKKCRTCPINNHIVYLIETPDRKRGYAIIRLADVNIYDFLNF